MPIKNDILLNLGANIVIKDLQLSVDIDKPLLIIKKAKSEFEQAIQSLEPSDNVTSQGEVQVLLSKNPIMGQLLDSFLNVSIDFKFNINNIHALLNPGNQVVLQV